MRGQARRPYTAAGASAVGDDFSDVCRDPGCGVCALWPQPGEARGAWLARVAGLYHAAPLHFRDQHEGGAA